MSIPQVVLLYTQQAQKKEKRITLEIHFLLKNIWNNMFQMNRRELNSAVESICCFRSDWLQVSKAAKLGSRTWINVQKKRQRIHAPLDSQDTAPHHNFREHGQRDARHCKSYPQKSSGKAAVVELNGCEITSIRYGHQRQYFKSRISKSVSCFLFSLLCSVASASASRFKHLQIPLFHHNGKDQPTGNRLLLLQAEFQFVLEQCCRSTGSHGKAARGFCCASCQSERGTARGV